MYGSRLSGANQVAPDGASVITAAWPSEVGGYHDEQHNARIRAMCVFCLSTPMGEGVGGHFDFASSRSQIQASNCSCWNCKDAFLPPPPLPPPQPPQPELPKNRARIVSRHLGTRLELPIEAADHPASSSAIPLHSRFQFTENNRDGEGRHACGPSACPTSKATMQFATAPTESDAIALLRARMFRKSWQRRFKEKLHETWSITKAHAATWDTMQTLDRIA